GVELVFGMEQRGVAAYAAVFALFPVVPVFAGEGELRALVAGDAELLRRQAFGPFGIGLFDLAAHHGLRSVQMARGAIAVFFGHLGMHHLAVGRGVHRGTAVVAILERKAVVEENDVADAAIAQHG